MFPSLTQKQHPIDKHWQVKISFLQGSSLGKQTPCNGRLHASKRWPTGNEHGVIGGSLFQNVFLLKTFIFILTNTHTLHVKYTYITYVSQKHIHKNTHSYNTYKIDTNTHTHTYITETDTHMYIFFSLLTPYRSF